MYNNIDINRWNNIKEDLKIKYPILTDSDLLWRDGGSLNDLLKELATRIGISWRELNETMAKM